MGRQQVLLQRAFPPSDPSDAGFRVFSQWDEDGIIQFLIDRVPIANDSFIEIGVEDYSECNTRFLLCNDDWAGLAVDSGDAHVRFLEQTGLRWRHQIDAVSAWVTAENVNDVISGAGFEGDIGLLSLDVDGNDYWVMDAIDVVSPRIMIVEYNSAFGSSRPVSVPYEAGFERTKKHYSNLYYGASLAALHHGAAKRGYRLVTCNRAGNNAFFVRGDVAGKLPDRTPAEAWVRSRFRESRDESGKLTYLDPHVEGLHLIGRLPMADVATGEVGTVESLLA